MQGRRASCHANSFDAVKPFISKLLSSTDTIGPNAVRLRRLHQLMSVVTVATTYGNDDIDLLASHFLGRFARETGRRLEGFTPEALAAMQAYHWPGNIRELRNCIERAVVLSASSSIDVSDLALSTLAAPGDTGKIQNPSAGFSPEPLADVEKRHILATLESTGGNKSKAAGLLGIERSTLDRKLARWAKAEK